MYFPIRGPYKITSDFDELRPLSKPIDQRKHKHGAIDYGVSKGTLITSPENGILYYHLLARQAKGTHNLFWQDKVWYAFSNYFYEIWGGLIIVEGRTGYTHVFAHIEASVIGKMLNEKTSGIDIIESEQGLLISNLSYGIPIGVAEPIGYSGNAGYSTGPHVHYEIHRNRKWIPHQYRENPMNLYGDRNE